MTSRKQFYQLTTLGLLRGGHNERRKPSLDLYVEQMEHFPNVGKRSLSVGNMGGKRDKPS